MRRSSKVALILALLLLGGSAVLLVQSSASSPRPEALIREALRDAEEAAQKRSVRGVMEIVSHTYKDAAGFNKDRLRLALVNALRQAQGAAYDVQVSAPRITMDKARPDQAIVMTTITVTERQNGGNLWGGQEVTLVMRKEMQRRWLVFTEPRWRVTSVVNLPPLPGSDAGGIFGL